MNLLDAFQEHYEKDIKIYETLFKQRQFQFKRAQEDKIFINNFIIVVALAIMIISRSTIPWMIGVICLSIIYTISASIKDQRKYVEVIKKDVVSPAIVKSYIQFDYSSNGIPENIFSDSNTFYGYDKYISNNMFKMIKDGRELLFGDIDLQEGGRDENRVGNFESIFKGIFIKAEANYFVDKPIYIEPVVKNKFIMATFKTLEKAFGMQRRLVKFDDLEFENSFETYSQNESEAKNCINKRFIEKLVEIRHKYNSTIYVTIKKNIVYLLMSDIDLINAEEVYNKGFAKGSLFGNVKNIQEILDVIALITDRK